jgi:hypothetical protein
VNYCRMTADNVKATIRSYRPSDLREICRVWLASWRSTGVEVAIATSEDELRARFAQGLDQGWLVTIAEMGGRIVGFMATRPCDGVLDQLFIVAFRHGRPVCEMWWFLPRKYHQTSWLPCASQIGGPWRHGA